MVKTINKISGKLILIIALIRIKYSASFRNKYLKSKKNIEQSQRKNFALPINFTTSIISIEDKRYFTHKGIDTHSIFRAILKNITSTRIEGASTINQQLIRNITNDRELNLKRKFNEVLLAVLIDYEFTKDEILNAYVNLYEFNTCKGISDFCKTEKYDLSKLSHFECYELAARFKYPSINRANYIRYLKRVRTIEIKQM
ncbi:biosynthetic peptidoglycan transglycosylase [Flavobacterium sp.]|uniref:biosynthetic peptidoglycan transglycosylase n=1 Tax=Flavobacterium sp. TaxID=239 RepID=UPI00391D3D96